MKGLFNGIKTLFTTLLILGVIGILMYTSLILFLLL